MRSLDDYAQEALKNALKPMYKEIEYLRAQLESKEKHISELISENHQLRHYHEESGLDRDRPMNCRYRLRKIASGQFAGQTDTSWFCPVCGMSVSNWEDYCVSCGQKLERKYLPEMEIKEDDQRKEKDCQ